MAGSSGTERARTTLAYLRRQITTGEWAVGARIPIEPELAEALGVGRSTIREAVRSLASIGMLETLPGRGTFVRSNAPTSSVLSEFLTAYTLEELLSYRRALEVEAAQQAARHRTPEDVAALEAAVSTTLRPSHCPAHGDGETAHELASRFHYLLFDAARNRLLASLYAGITEKLAEPGHVERLTHAGDAHSMQAEHERIVDAVRRGDFIDAVHAMADHMDNDLVILAPDDEVIPPLRRSADDKERIEAARTAQHRERATG
ncbi:FadR/GntR family transcriptional regulator [Georgenia sp. H159]|uniref:FadR/GntR family transcriptional regulator n=1 Tax=Georgenia sp. H159 TaxID=3076115 RepID=UPI002D767C61|nr:FCD domain-containing protein [Georgenia sp. H159]